MIIPENIITKGIRSFIAFATTSYTADITSDKSNNILYSLFKTDDNDDLQAMDSFDYYTQAVAIICKPNTEARTLDVFQGYNQQRQGLPSIHVLLPHEGKGVQDSLGDSESMSHTEINSTTQMLTITKQKSFSPTYSLMITSINSAEVLLIYYFLRAMFILWDQHFEFKGLQKMTYTGADISFQPDLPPGIYHRSLSLSFDYLINIKTSFSVDTITGLEFIQSICVDDEV